MTVSFQDCVFDYGGVIANIDLPRMRRRLRDLGISLWRQFWHKSRLEAIARLFTDGLDDGHRAVEALRALCRPGTTSNEVRNCMDEFAAQIPPERLNIIAELRRRGCRVFLLSNNHPSFWSLAKNEMHRLGHPPAKLFDGICLSCEMGVAKPDRQAYEIFTARLGVVPEKTLYFDDEADNVTAAAAMGFKAVRVPRNRLESVPEFRQLLASLQML